MSLFNSLRIIESSDAAQRLAEAAAWLESQAGGEGVLIVGASRGAADDLARRVAVSLGGAVGLHRFSVAQLAARLAAPVLAARGIAPATFIGSEAVAARATFEARRGGALDYFEPVAGTPGFPRALARTLHELALANVSPPDLRALPLGGSDLALLMERFDEQFAAAEATDRALLFDAALAAPLPRFPLLLLDVPMESSVEFELVRRLIASSPDSLVTVPFGDLATLGYLRGLGTEVEVLEPPGTSDLSALRRHLFAKGQPPVRQPTGEVMLFSAPGEERECVEIVRRILQEARGGVPFDEIAVFLRSPREYVGLLEHAFARAGIAAWFDRGTRRPHPSGRAFLAILSCAVERLSAARFAEYLSLGQVPPSAPEGAGGLVQSSLPADDLLTGFTSSEPAPDGEDGVGEASESDDEDAAIVEGTLRAPWKWEELIVESAVVGGNPDRWHRRLRGLAEQFQHQIKEEAREDPESPRLLRLGRDAKNLRHLRAFALPVIDALSTWPATATWGEWLNRFEALSPLVLRKPARVLRVLNELRPMGAIGPVTLEEARDVLAERLRTLDEHPPVHRYGRVFVGSPHQARGRAFRVVFVPGLAERMFPQKPREDPMLLDREMREPLHAGLFLQDDRARTERLLLRLAVGAATRTLWLSYPRIDLSGARPRVPSFYVLDVMRAVTGQIPNHEDMQRDAALTGGARLDWPAPLAPSSAIDQVEHDLATLRVLFERPDRHLVRGHAHYLLRLNDALRRSVTMRWARARSKWMPQDGIVRTTPAIGPMLATQRLTARPYSLSALQKFATCPYQFMLAAIYRLEPNVEPVPLQRLDPLTRGALFHEVQARFFRELHAQSRLPVETANVPDAIEVVDRVLKQVASEYHEQLAPAIERVWADEIAAIGRDLRVWVRRLPESREWLPEYFEFSFGLSDEGRDPRSHANPVTIDNRFLLRGSVDVVEQSVHGATLRVTDHKTGRDRSSPRTVIGGGNILQPVLYSVAVEQILGRPVTAGRLFYCTAAGGFSERIIPLTEVNRRAGIEALEIVDRAIELGFLPPAPAERACTWCDFRVVCGPDEHRHAARKPQEPLGDLISLREKP